MCLKVLDDSLVTAYRSRVADCSFIDRSNLQNVPGTVLLNDTAGHAEEAAHDLKHGTGRDSHIILSPQPSEDPNDPLNWAKWRKEVIIAILSLGAMLNAGTNVYHLRCDPVYLIR